MKKELKIGIFSVGVIVASVFMLNYLRGKDIFNNELELVGQCEDVQGLVASAPVYIKGYKAGKVSEVVYNSSVGLFDVKCSVQNSFDLPVDSKIMIASTDIMGSKGLKIVPGTSQDLAEDGDTLKLSVEEGFMDSISETVSPIIGIVANTLDTLNRTLSGVNKLLSDANVARISRTLASLEVTVNNIKSVSASINGRSDDISLFISNLTDFSSQLKGLATKVDSAIDGVNGVVGTINEADLAGVITSFKTLLNNINDPDGTVGKLLSDDSVYNSVDSLLVDINSIVDKIKENPKKYLKVSLF